MLERIDSMVGIIRRIDDVGRVCIPREYRRFLGINNLDKLEIICEEDCVVIKPVRKENE